MFCNYLLAGENGSDLFRKFCHPSRGYSVRFSFCNSNSRTKKIYRRNFIWIRINCLRKLQNPKNFYISTSLMKIHLTNITFDISYVKFIFVKYINTSKPVASGFLLIISFVSLRREAVQLKRMIKIKRWKRQVAVPEDVEVKVRLWL